MTDLLKQFVTQLDEALPYPRHLRDQVIEEVHDHLHSLTAKARAEGLPQAEAEEKALSIFGTVEQFVDQFADQGGPVAASDSISRGFSIFVGAYVGLVLGVIVWTFVDEPLVTLVALVGGAFAGGALLVRRSLGPLVGAAMGAILGNVAIAHYLIANSPGSFGGPDQSMSRSITLWSTVIAGLVGLGLGLIPRLRRDPAPLLWATTLALAFHVAARLWLEDFPTLTGMAMLLVGLLVGGCLGVLGAASRFTPVPLGAMLGFAAGGALLLSGVAFNLFSWLGPGAILWICPLLGAATGTVIVVRSTMQERSRSASYRTAVQTFL